MCRIFLVFLVAVGCSGKPSGADGGLADGDAGLASGADGGLADGGRADGGATKFALSASPEALSVGQGGVTNALVSLSHGDDTSRVLFSVKNLPPGVTATFSPVSSLGETSRLTVSASSTAPVLATGSLVVEATGANTAKLSVPITVTEAVSVLLVDDDGSENNHLTANPTLSTADVFFRDLLTSANVKFNTFVVNAGADGPGFQQMKNYTTVMWYCGAGSLTTTDEGVLSGFLDQGARKVVLFAPQYALATDPTASWTSVTNGFLSVTLGYQGLALGQPSDGGVVVTGAGPMTGLSLTATETPTALNPKPSTAVFFTAVVTLDPSLGDAGVDAGVLDAGPVVAVATGRKAVGAMGNSKILLFSFPFENGVDAPDTKAEVFSRVLAY